MTEAVSGQPSELPLARYHGLTPELFDRLAPYLAESVAVVDAEGRVTRLLGPPAGALGIGHVVGRHIFEYCHPEDLPRAVELAVEALASAPGWHATWTTRLRNVEGEAVEFEIFIENCTDDPVIDGFILRLRSLPVRGAPDDPLFAPELGQELESLAGVVPLPIAFIGSDARLYYLNDAARELCGERVADLEHEGLAALANGTDRVAIETAVASLLDRPGERTVVFELAGTAAGVHQMIEARISALGQGEHVLALFATLIDVTVRHIEESELRRRASSDPLTGLHNRNEVEDALSGRLEEGADRVGLLYIDLDGFKAVNDTFGHEAGDEFLVEVASILTATVRRNDLVGRLGGDEFTVIFDLNALPGPRERRAQAITVYARRVGQAIAAYARKRGLGVTASVGSATGGTGDTPRDLLRRADRAMYEEKRTRRISSIAE